VEGNYELLKLELTEHNAFVRHNFQLYIGWYTFFLTVNFGAIGWFTSNLLTGALKDSLPIIFVAIFFVVQIVLSYMGSLEVRNYFVVTGKRSNELLDLMVAQPPDRQMQPKTAIPIDVYVRIISLICGTLMTFVFFWVSLSIVAIYQVPLRQHIGERTPESERRRQNIGQNAGDSFHTSSLNHQSSTL